MISKNKKAVGENVPKLIYDNETLEILHANEAAATVFGFSVTQLLNSKISDICLDDFSELIDNEKVQFPIDKLSRMIQNKRGERFSCHTKDFEIDFETSLITFHGIQKLNSEKLIFSVLEFMN